MSRTALVASIRRHAFHLTLIAVLAGASFESRARVLSLEIERRTPIQNGQPFASAEHHDGIAYELIEGHVHFGFDPKSPANTRVSDLALAPLGASGLVEATADFVALQPIDPEKRRGTALVDVPNRGRRLALSGMNRVQKDFLAPATLDPDGLSDWGDGFLMSRGLTVLWVGWQADVPAFAGGMGLEVPRAVAGDGSPVRGLARSDWVVDEATDRLALAVLGHATHRPVRVDGPTLSTLPALPTQPVQPIPDVLTRRRGREAARESVPRSHWDFDPTGLAIVSKPDGRAGFEAGWIYELAYVSQAPPLVGLGFAAFRDFSAYAETDPSCPFPIERSIAHGLSQSGRFLRHFLYEGFNVDESGRKVFDGVMIQIGGAGRGGFNHRFAHPGRVGNPYDNFFYPGDEFPFASRPTTDGNATEGLLDRARLTSSIPKLFQINTGYEYWGRGASLIHMTPDGKADVEPLESERLYHIASAPHYSLPFPPAPQSEVMPGLFVGSSIDTSNFQRALLGHLIAWVEQDVAPPNSVVPRIDANTLVDPGSLRYPVAELVRPRSPHVAYHLDFGPRWSEGIIDVQPPRRGSAYGIRVPSLDPLGSEITGLRALELRVPIGTYTPWALRFGKPGGADEMTGYIGSFLPLARSDTMRREGDERPSVERLYASRETYDQRVAQEIDAMVDAGWMLPEDRAQAWGAAMQRWNWIVARPE